MTKPAMRRTTAA